MRSHTFTLASLWLALAVPAFASDGVLEINQTKALAGGVTPGDTQAGFPVVISLAGSYRLTSDLVVPAGLNAIELSASDVSLDLNGFAIRGPEFCASLICPAGAGSGVAYTGIFGGGRMTLTNGRVQGFGADCVKLGDHAHVERLMVLNCGGDGIDVSFSSVVLGNRVSQTRGNGLTLNGSAFRDNVMDSNGFGAIGGTGGVSVTGGKPTGGNLCADGRCTPRGEERRYYLAPLNYSGSQALTACAAGFHMASLWEIFDFTALTYDRSLGIVRPDSSAGPPAGGSAASGWVRTAGFLQRSTARGQRKLRRMVVVERGAKRNASLAGL